MSTAAGRPRDPEVDRRIADAAVDLFGRTGWAGFSMDAVARAAGVGKASIYLRHPSKERLLADALTLRLADVADVDSGTLRGDLVLLTRQLLDIYRGESGRAVLRLIVEAPAIPDVGARWETLRASQVRAARAMVRRGIERGEIPAGTSVTMLLDTLCGGVLMHVWSAPEHLQARMAADVESYAAELVDFLVGAVQR